MYFTRSDLFKTLCLTLICNIKKDFALRNPVIFFTFQIPRRKSTCTGKYNGFVRENILNKHNCGGLNKKQTLHVNPSLPCHFLQSLEKIRGILAR